MAELTVEFGDLVFKNPIIAASGEPTTDYEHMVAAIRAGAGAVVAKSISFSKELSISYSHPRWAVIDEDRAICKESNYPKLFTFLGRGGIPLEPDNWIETLVRVNRVADEHGTVLIGSIATGPLSEMIDAARRMESAGIKMIEVDGGCSQVSHLDLEDSTLELVKNYEIAAMITKAVSEAVSIPVIYKVAAEDGDILQTCQAVKKAGAAAVTLLNRHTGFLVDLDTGEPHTGSMGGVGGPWMLPLTLRWISHAYLMQPDYIIFGSNGAYDWRDALQFLFTGATFVQYCSVLMLKGYGVITETIEQVSAYMDGKGYTSLPEMIGKASRKAKSYSQLYGSGKKAVIDRDLCTDCAACLEVCFYNGLVYRGGQVIETGGCRGCTLCESACSSGAIKTCGGAVTD